ncbi:MULTISPECIES: hypothetical protein [Arenibacter]|uniref:hypothetical protein n=1 Tax=Arenibacter TaxID=178469 RepID=UPI001C06EDBB|nr:MULTISPECIES: hypothetical protein [Arenibacter]MBU2905585.1 hypothetical protein [Arenibacter algicola]MCK0133678.1 hypothetical protein [Arenibacter sp. S6351L]
MVRKFSYLLLLVFFSLGCESNGDGCEEGYVRQVGPDASEWCVEEFREDGTEYRTGESCYHQKYGLITFTSGIWTDKHNQVINP